MLTVGIRISSLQTISGEVHVVLDISAQLSTKTRDELDDIVDDAEREFLIYLVVSWRVCSCVSRS